MFTSFPFISLTSFGKRRRIANSINCGTLHLSGRAAVIFVEIKIDYTSKVRSTVTLNRILLMIKDRNDTPPNGIIVFVKCDFCFYVANMAKY